MIINTGTLQALLSSLRNDQSEKNIKNLVKSDAFIALQLSYTEFLKQETGPMTVFWQSYIDFVLLLLQFVRATRDGNWNLHVDSVRALRV